MLMIVCWLEVFSKLASYLVIYSPSPRFHRPLVRKVVVSIRPSDQASSDKP